MKADIDNQFTKEPQNLEPNKCEGKETNNYFYDNKLR